MDDPKLRAMGAMVNEVWGRRKTVNQEKE